MELALPIALAALGIIGGLNLVIGGMMRADTKAIRADMTRGSERMRDGEKEVAAVRERVSVRESECARNHTNSHKHNGAGA